MNAGEKDRLETIIYLQEMTDQVLLDNEAETESSFASRATLEMSVLRISELLIHFSAEFKSKFPQINWLKINKMRKEIEKFEKEIPFSEIWKFFKVDVPLIISIINTKDEVLI